MPIGSTIPFNTYTENGVQSLDTVLNDNGDEPVISSFLTSDQKKYLYGFNTNTIQDTNNFKKTLNNVKRSQIQIANDSDAISNISFSYRIEVDRTTGTTDKISKTLGYELIKKIKVIIGNVTYQEISGYDIACYNSLKCSSTEEYLNQSTEISPSRAVTHVDPTIVPGNANSEKYSHFEVKTDPLFYVIEGSFDTGIFSGLGEYQQAYLQCAAANNMITLDVEYTDFTSSTSTILDDSIKSLANVEFNFITRTFKMTDFERDYARKNAINVLSCNTQSIFRNIRPSMTLTSDRFVSVIVDLSTISIDTSHLVVALYKTEFTPQGKDPDSTISSSLVASTMTNYAQHLSNSYPLHRGAVGDTTAQLRSGIYTPVKSLEVISNGSSVTGVLDGKYCLTETHKHLGFNHLTSTGFYVIPLTGKQYGIGSHIYSKLNQKTLRITFDKFLLVNGGTVTNQPADEKFHVNVTAYGKSLLTYVGGQVNISYS